ncbi:2Fe-2S iron-sulfur cluster-binding protein [Paenibacillus sp. y28]|uniref:2Fe-2S iron-sulfur cluster-binding protein n=1 Tax=Paenibacillus sp. y28 TaxID=3129110 RepID=UPI003019E382
MGVKLTFLPDNKTIEVPPGTSVLHAARKANLIIRSRCAGNAACLMCKVTALSGQGLSQVQDKEARKLGPLVKQNVRLACQVKIIGDAQVEVPEDPLKAVIRAKLREQQEEDKLW